MDGMGFIVGLAIGIFGLIYFVRSLSEFRKLYDSQKENKDDD